MVAKFSIRLLDRVEQMRPLAELLASVWQMPVDQSELSPDLLRALAFTDNYVAGAFVGDDLVGGAVGFWGSDTDGPVLHSHVTGVVSGMYGTGVGFALKQHQREWTLARNVARITWTFDPLVRRNAYFNLVKLGAYFDQYHESFYGEMLDPINAGDQSDRVVAVWDFRNAGATADGANGTDMISIAVPEDIVALRATDPASSLKWRHRTRAQFQAAFANGYRATSITKAGEYQLTRAAGR